MLRAIGTPGMFLLAAMSAHAEDSSFLYCEYESLGDEALRKSQSIPLYYDDGELVAVGKRSHCVDDPQFSITETHAAWRCSTALNADQTIARSVYVEIHRYTGRYHRNDFDGAPSLDNMRDIWHGVCKAYSEPQF
ncbi:hypothetical protein [Celeribacter halophilus]|uniref:hypothetical protein n=1 Tax=Celeribacter halophilus TaxID=576117 RepID=UPI0026E20C3D|nr:hypothetical protein [Celeribacter halophilus]